MFTSASSEAPSSPFAEAVRIIGSQGRMARLLGVSQPAVFRWVNGKLLPAEHVLTIEAATGISRHDLRPDIYPREESAAPRQGIA